ncbi:unnamed protein product [Rotaria sordida]|uniref:Protein quiver n=1 Tax=Rotaria sordida TaxID=392033 RepID=A0A813WPW6_9BILA|nr:unnamed protein product [Rotaria sordida]CAF0897022.1 unnamed protein product [Rotaria sordida]CAF1231244.1 unnamed protein product [Rotaria sordida]CAF1241642.1 unnamed protein product [Rotaria sordida]
MQYFHKYSIMKLFLVALVCFIGICSTQAYQCYRCDSASKPGCNDPFNSAQAEAQWKVEAKANERCKKVKVFGGLRDKDHENILKLTEKRRRIQEKCP